MAMTKKQQDSSFPTTKNFQTKVLCFSWKICQPNRCKKSSALFKTFSRNTCSRRENLRTKIATLVLWKQNCGRCSRWSQQKYRRTNTNRIFVSENYVNIFISLRNNFHRKEDIYMLCENIIRSLKKMEKYTRNKCSYNLMEETNRTFLERKSLDLIMLMLSIELSSWRCFLSFCISSSCKPISSALRCRLFFEISTYILCYEAVTVRIFLSFAKYLLIFSR